MRLGNKQTSMNLHLLLVSAKLVLYFHIYWQSSFGRDLSEHSVSHTVKPVEEEFVPSVPWVLVLGTSWEVQDQAASPKLTSEFAKPVSAPWEALCKAGWQKRASLVDEAAKILMFLSITWFGFQTAELSPATCFSTWLAFSGHREVLTVQALQRQPDLIQA